MMDMHEKREKLQEYLREPGCTPIMCAYDVLSAKLIENAGFPIVYTGSFYYRCFSVWHGRCRTCFS